MNPPNDGRFPGGPTTPQIELDRKIHKCESIWIGNIDYQRPSARYHGQSQSKMLMETHDARRKKLHDIGFGLISSFNWLYTDLPLCFTVAERFWPKSYTFHFPVGEMTITLEDIYNITSLPIVGYALTCQKLRDYGPIIERCLGKKPNDEESCRTGKIKLEWLKNEFGTLPENATEEQVEFYTRAYLLALCGNCLFPNSTSSYVNAYYLQFLEDLDEAKNYAWGAAVLAYLFKCLTEFVTSKNATDIRGFVPVLQVWSYLHIPTVGRPHVAPDALSFPFLAKYCTGDRKYLQEPHRSTLIYRQEFDLLTHDMVVWAPYGICNDQMHLLWSHRSCLIHMKTITPHPVERCMRQIQYVQDIPGDPIHCKKVLNDAISAWEKRTEPQYSVAGIRIIENMNGVIHGATIRYLNWYGIPIMHNLGLKYEEQRYTPRGYGDKVADVLWKRCCRQADELDGFLSTIC